MMIKLARLGFLCSRSKQPTPAQQLETVLTYYKSGKSTLSVSQNVVHKEQALQNLYPNYYIHPDLCTEIERTAPGFCSKSMQAQETELGSLRRIFRLVTSANISSKHLSLNINSLKANPFMKSLIEMKESGKFVTKTSQVIIDDEVAEKPGSEIEERLKANIMEVEKLIEDGLGLPISFMISKTNVQSPSWLKLLAKKRKSIRSDIIECASSQKEGTKKALSLEQIVYDHGFKLEHLFLRPYCNGCPTDLLAKNDSFNLEQLVKVLNLIDFEGKIVLENTDSFYANIDFLDAALRKCGYQKKRSGSIDLINEYIVF